MSFIIRKIRLREIRLPLREPFTISSGSIDVRRIMLVEVVDDDGVSGWGECVADADPNYSPEIIETATTIIDGFLAPRILRRKIDHPREVAPIFADGIRGHFMAKAALEMAIWALAAEKAGVPLAKLLGGERERIPVGISIGIQKSKELLVERARRAAADGYRRIKLKIKPGADIDHVAAVREALGPDAVISVDANAAYRIEDADHVAALDRFGLLMIEQPLRAGDVVRHAQLAKRIKTPICLDESIESVDDAEVALELGACRLINIKPGRVGGFASSLAIHDLCRSRGIKNWCGGMLESGIGRAHNVALASLANFELPGDISPSARYWAEDIVTPEWTMDKDGYVTVPWQKPGLGVRIDVEKLDRISEWRRRIE